MVGGAFLCYEGFEKIAHRFLHAGDDPKPPLQERARVLIHNVLQGAWNTAQHKQSAGQQATR